jgi:hypothetical protein
LLSGEAGLQVVKCCSFGGDKTTILVDRGAVAIHFFSNFDDLLLERRLDSRQPFALRSQEFLGATARTGKRLGG